MASSIIAEQNYGWCYHYIVLGDDGRSSSLSFPVQLSESDRSAMLLDFDAAVTRSLDAFVGSEETVNTEGEV